MKYPTQKAVVVGVVATLALCAGYVYGDLQTNLGSDLAGKLKTTLKDPLLNLLSSTEFTDQAVVKSRVSAAEQAVSSFKAMLEQQTPPAATAAMQAAPVLPAPAGVTQNTLAPLTSAPVMPTPAVSAPSTPAATEPTIILPPADASVPVEAQPASGDSETQVSTDASSTALLTMPTA